MFRLPLSLALAALGCAALTAPARADSSVSLASDSASDSVGSVSNSLGHSSDSSRHGGDMAQGDYRIVEMAAAAGRPGMLRLQLQALAQPGPEGRHTLDLPQPTAERERLAAGQVLSVRDRTYGLALARADAPQPFFLVLDDTWMRELRSKAVAL
ncbi:MAG: hypothetical protein KGL43_25105 [Burkholderiales bacterium]|nr:hypothetical protein [Burkholderiales bacterium]MDE2456882.1 hypothetical protein [Burkholderiales bacterium]